jgi:alcohol dehydrogenase class IV
MTSIRFDGSAIPATIVSGLGCRKQAVQEIDRLGFKRVLIICSPTLRQKTAFITELEQDLGERLVGIYDEVKPNAPESAIRDASEHARHLSPDAILSVGGGAVHDTAKGVAVMCPSGRSITDFVSRFEPPDTFHSVDVDVEPLPVLTMASTFSAADVVGGGAVTNETTGEKLIFVHPKLTPICVFLDGEIVASTPRNILAESGMNAVHHCLEALYSKGHQPITDALALEALRRLVDTLPRLAPSVATPDPKDYQRALEATSMSGLTYANSWLGIGHSVCHSLGGRYGLSHGAANSVMVRHSIRFNLSHASNRLELAAGALGASFPSAQKALAARHMIAVVDWLSEILETPVTLREIGLPEGQFERIAKDVMADPQTYWNPRPATEDEVIALLRDAW